jgi:hypothetical protein
MAALSPISDRIVNQRPEQRAEKAYGAATQEFNQGQTEDLKNKEEQRAETTAQQEEPVRAAQAREANARADSLENPPDKQGLTPEETTIHDLMTGQNGQPRLNPQTGKPYSYLEAFGTTKQIAQDTKPDPAEKDKDKDITDYLQAHGLSSTPANREKARGDIADRGKQEPGSFMPLYDEKGHVSGAWDPKSGRVVKGPESGSTAPEAAAKRTEVTAHDKAYVQPAEAIEKSYQMSDAAYKEYEAARVQGKDLPTGAQSMLQLSTHLSTTFGNVKGARITKDMIQEHLGARSISDAALVAVQKLTNGDVLSPDQWTAFHDLISQSRKLSWQIAAKEADRKHIPVDFLPQDLAQTAHEPGQQKQAPSAGTVEGGYRFKGGNPADKNNWEKQ